MPLVIYSLGGGHTYTGGMKVISRNQAFQDFKKPGLKKQSGYAKLINTIDNL